MGKANTTTLPPWRHNMGTLSKLLTLCGANSLVYFSEWKFLYFDYNFTEFVRKDPIEINPALV